MFNRKQAIDRWYIFPPHPVSVSTLPCKTKNTEIMSFHLNVVRCFANRHTILFTFHHLVIDRLPFVRKTKSNQIKWNLFTSTKDNRKRSAVYSNNTKIGHKAPSLPLCTQSAFTMSAVVLGGMSIMGVLFIEHGKSASLSMRYFTTAC